MQQVEKLMHLIAVIPQGLEEEGGKEFAALGAKSIKLLRRSVAFQADIACLYRVYLRARLPFRVLREISRFKCNSPETLFRLVQEAFDWERWLHPSKSFRVDVSGSCVGLSHTHFSALQVKNALVDLQRDIWGHRSKIDLKTPDICLHLHLSDYESVLSLDGSIGSLHRRGNRPAMGLAPLKENLAAGLIALTQWDRSVPLVDPLCGSGTFLIEAANAALGSFQESHRKLILKNWADFDNNIWEKELHSAKNFSNLSSQKPLPLILGFEKDKEIANQAKTNILYSNLQDVINIRTGSFQNMQLPSQKGIVICNPPYGLRIGCEEDLAALYRDLGLFLKSKASGWQLWLLSGNPQLTKFLGMKANRRFQVNNGGIDCRWIQYLIH